MKKILFTTFTAICISIIIPCKTYALDITLGATTWYALSELYYTQDKSPGIINNSLVKSDPAFLYGPTLAVRFSNDFNITFVYLYGHFKTEKNPGSGYLTNIPLYCSAALRHSHCHIKLHRISLLEYPALFVVEHIISPKLVNTL